MNEESVLFHLKEISRHWPSEAQEDHDSPQDSRSEG
jgi:hypothetical protein